MSSHDAAPHPFGAAAINLLDPRLGAAALSASDEFFAPKERMLNPDVAVFIPGKYDDNGKWMDGWESRRKRVAGHDHCICRLAFPGRIAGFDIDTSHFTGNFPPAASIDACRIDGDPDTATAWQTIAPATSLTGNNHHFIASDSDDVFTHVRLNIYPDGGVARLRAYGRPVTDCTRLRGQRVNVAAVELGAYAVACSDQHYGSPMRVLFPGRGINMGDGWETRRRREPGNDWCILALAQPTAIDEIEIDTAHFKGNFPDRCSIQAAMVTAATDQSIVTQSMFWQMLLPEQKMAMDKQHVYKGEIGGIGPVSHVRLNVIPDGGVSRLRLWGRVA
ncbi:allantoicase [Dongia rigui]|uniref:Probable allantoicase n=1 Tax=Dongia rigui TaxID=940149 RepID=A0ABU5DUI9_9PROT|nr:allantoicase [Dongia rigui]MDY0870622.1 allantoicase [Dongia rigui]